MRYITHRVSRMKFGRGSVDDCSGAGTSLYNETLEIHRRITVIGRAFGPLIVEGDGGGRAYRGDLILVWGAALM